MPDESGAKRARLVEATLTELSSVDPGNMARALRRWTHGRLSLLHLHVLMHLQGDAAVPMSEIADAIDVSQASTTGIIDRMEERGLVQRQRDSDDRRVVNVSLTDAGREVIAAIATERREGLARLLEDLSDAELAALLRGTRALGRARERRLTDLELEQRGHKGRDEHQREPAR